MTCCDGPKCLLEAGDPRHGTVNGYTHGRCRCAACRSENTARQTARRRRIGILARADYWQARRAALPPVTHGTERAISEHYRSGSPVCDVCRGVQRERDRRNRARRVAAGVYLIHGRVSTYRNGCRCAACRDASRREAAEYRARRRAS